MMQLGDKCRVTHRLKTVLLFFLVLNLLLACKSGADLKHANFFSLWLPDSDTLNSTGALDFSLLSKPINIDFTVDLILPGKISDPGWSQEAYLGLKAIQKFYQANIRITENVTGDMAKKEILKLLNHPPELLFAYGGEYVEALEDIAEKYPDTDFIGTNSSGGNNRNFGSIYFDSFSTAFIAGAIAGIKSDKKHVSIVLGSKIPNALSDAKAFELGVRYIDSRIKVQTIWVGTWTDSYLASQKIKVAIADGIDVFAINSYMGDHEAIKTVAAAGLSSIAFHEDKSHWSPESVLTSILVNHRRLIQFGVQLVFEGRWNGRHYLLGARDGVVTLAPLNPHKLDSIQREKILEIWNRLTSGEIIGVF